MYDDGVGSVAPFADVNGDQLPDVLVGAGGNSRSDSVLCLCGVTGATIWRTRAAASVSDVERIRDVNNSGTDDAVAGGWDYAVYCLEGSTGDVIWSTPLGTARVVMEVVPVRDVNGDGADDVVVGSWSQMVTVLSGRDGATVWNGYLASDVWAVDTLADVTGDGVPEIVAGCLGNGNGMVRVFAGSSGDVLWQYSFSERVYDVTGAPDMNGDGRPDVLVGLQDQGHEPAHLLLFDGAPPSPVAEPTGCNTSGLRYDPVTGRLCLEVNTSRAYRLGLYDRSGRMAGRTIVGTGPVEHQVQVSGLTPGVCFARLWIAGREEKTLKFVVPRRK
jgi:outer membrane protein assembly factor BamB